MTTRYFQFRGLGATLTDLIGDGAPASNVIATGSTGGSSFARPPPTRGITLLLADPGKATLAIDPTIAAATEEAARTKAELEAAKKALDDANAAFAAARAGDKGTRGGELMPVKLYQELQDRLALAEKRASDAQAMHESVSIGARIGAALKWAALPAAAGAIVIGMAPPKGKVIGVGLTVLGLSLGVFRYFRGAQDASVWNEET